MAPPTEDVITGLEFLVDLPMRSIATTPTNKRGIATLETEEEEDYEVTFSSTPTVQPKKPRMANSEKQSPGRSDRSLSVSIVNKLKDHFDKKTRETQNDFRTYMKGVEGRVEKNSEQISEIKEAILRIERSSTSSQNSGGDETEANLNQMNDLREWRTDDGP